MSAEIQYIDHPRPDTGLTNGKLGVWLFLASEVMLFGAFFSAFILLKVGAPENSWPAHQHDVLSVPLAFVNTMILISSSVTMVMAWASCAMKDFAGYKKWMWATFLLACGFLVVKSIEYGTKFSHDIYPATSNFYGIYFTMTGLHGLHVVGGMIVMLYFLGPGAKLWNKNQQMFTNRIENTGLYWHFVDLVWIFLFPVFYLL